MGKDKNRLVIAIDGPSGAGKSTTARKLAGRLGYIYIDTGALYRAIGWKARSEGIDPADEAGLADLVSRTTLSIKNDNNNPRFFVDGHDVTGEIRTPEMGMIASSVSKSPAIRARLLTIQRELGKNGGVVLDGRDIGTVVFPQADLKFYLDATVAERGKRRYEELKAKGIEVDLERTISEISDRDRQDSDRSLAPLKKAPDAVLIDSTAAGVDEVIEKMMHEVEKAKGK